MNPTNKKPSDLKHSAFAKGKKEFNYFDDLDLPLFGAVPFHSQMYPFTLPEKSVVSAHFPVLLSMIKKLCPEAPDG